MYNRYVCEHCGANLDPNEHCDCEVERRRNKRIRSRYYNDIFEYMKDMEELNDERVAI